MEALAPLLGLGFLVQTIRISTPYVFAAVGGAISERSGVVNLALEGVLTLSALAFVAATLAVGGGRGGAPACLLAGLAASVAAGAALGGLLALTAVLCRANHIVCGLALNLLAAGLSPFFLGTLYGSASNTPEIVSWAPPAWFGGGEWAALNDLLNPLIALAALAALAAAWMLKRTRFGLQLRAAGEDPEAARAAGANPRRIRIQAAALGCALAGLGGAWLAMAQARYADQMSAGRGYMAVAAMIVGRWSPLGAAAAALLFGFAEAAGIRLQLAGFGQLGRAALDMVPYLLTIFVLAGFVGKSTMPAALGRPV